MMRKAILVSIKPQYVREILEGRKKIELRKCLPKEVADDDFVIIYCTHPVKAVVGFCKINSLITDSPENIWNRYSSLLGIDKKDFFEYYQNSTKAVGIELAEIKTLKNKLSLETIKLRLPNFSPPQTYKYFKLSQIYSLFKDQISIV